MTIKYKKDGSGWHRWDLHLHGPGTKLANGYGDTSEENLRAYLEVLEDSDVQVFGICLTSAPMGQICGFE